jgi:hypothetical protein
MGVRHAIVHSQSFSADHRPAPLLCELVEGSLHERGDRLIDGVDVRIGAEPPAQVDRLRRLDRDLRRECDVAE